MLIVTAKNFLLYVLLKLLDIVELVCYTIAKVPLSHS